MKKWFESWIDKTTMMMTMDDVDDDDTRNRQFDRYETNTHKKKRKV